MVKFGQRLALLVGFAFIGVGIYILASRDLTALTLLAVLGSAVSAGIYAVKYWNLRFTKPDEVVGPPTKPQIRRWFLFRSKRLQIVLHHHLRSDPPVMHDH